MNDVLRDAGSSFRLRPAPGCPAAWADAVTLAQLTNHTALGMHYVWGGGSGMKLRPPLLSRYMSPERINGEGYGTPSDVWGLGLSLMATALGKLPISTRGGYW